jgi:RND family efflux transporter MFP subunit
VNEGSRFHRLAPLAAVALAALVVGMLLGVAYAGGLASTPSPATPSPRVTPRPTPTASPTPVDTSVRAHAVVVPLRSVDVAPTIAGRVARLVVIENQHVFTDQVLVRLDQSAQQAAVDVAGANVNRAEKAVRRAEAEAELLPGDASQAQLDAAEAEVSLARAELQLAQSTLAEAEVALRQTEIRAPFEGVVASMDVAVGEQVEAGQPMVTVADFTSWLIETTDMSELDVVRIAVGDRATITFSALPDIELAGTVDHIQVRGSTDGSGASFTVVIKPDERLSELRWNMSAEVRVLPGQ